MELDEIRVDLLDFIKKERTLEDFRGLRSGMTVDEVLNLIDRPDAYEGSGLLYHVYNLHDGNQIRLLFTEQGLDWVLLKTTSGEKVPLLDENGSMRMHF